MGKIEWAFNVWLARRFLRNMTVDKVSVLAHVSGLPAESFLALHPSCGPSKQRRRVIA